MNMLTTTLGDGASPTGLPQVGDIVRVGQGSALWRITGFWVSGPTRFAELARTDRQWVRSSATPDRLTVVHAATDTVPWWDAAKANA